MNIRKSAIALVLILIVCGGAYSGYWLYARQVASDIIADWTEARRVEGYQIAYDPPELNGYPFLIRAVLQKPRLRRNAFEWRAEQLGIEFQPWNFQRIRMDVEGRQWLTLSDDQRTIILNPKEAALVARFSDTGRIAKATLLLRDLEISQAENTDLSRVAEIWLEAVAAQEPPKRHIDRNFTLSLSAAEIVLPEAANGPLGRDVSKLRADLQLNGALTDGAFEEALETWRQSGGTLDVDWFHLAWGELDLRAKGTVALDAEARPLGAFSTDIRGHSQALDALVDRALLERKTATLAKVALSLLAKTPPEGGAPVLTVPVTAQDGRLYAGPIKILDLAPIRFQAQRR
ncbi:MAG: DUF2125 domain-containing protein [Alphaproteobacteria bacterium]|nr:DUF2125 domain-containing protein [Alphaproteobacteria bacterium]